MPTKLMVVDDSRMVHFEMLRLLEGIDYVLVDAEENEDLTRKYGVMQAPTLVVVDGDHARKYVNASNIQKFVNESMVHGNV